MSVDRWEHGSDFELAEFSSPSGALPWWFEEGSFWQSGRAALLAILEQLRLDRGSTRVWLPAYYCEDVLPPVAAAGWEILRYDNAPGDVSVALGAGQRAGDVVVTVAYFGIIPAPTVEDLQPGSVLVEDHTHDPLSESARRSTAAWCFASLRKTLPLPDGGVAWSPAGERIRARYERQPSDDRTSSIRLAAMALKRAYLRGAAFDKSMYRELFRATERELGVGSVVDVSPWTMMALRHASWDNWRAQRRMNHSTVANAVADVNSITPILTVVPGSAPVVFSFLLRDPSQRRTVAERLVHQRVYPVHLWILPNTALPRAGAFSERHMAVQCDQRYTAADMERVAEYIRLAFAAA